MKPEGKEKEGGREGEGEPAARLEIYDRRVYRDGMLHLQCSKRKSRMARWCSLLCGMK